MESSEKACPFGDLTFLKYDTSGTMVWMEHTLGTNYNIANGVTVDNLGNCFVTGYYTDSIWLSSFLRTALDGSDILLFRFHDATFNLYNGIYSSANNNLNAISLSTTFSLFQKKHLHKNLLRRGWDKRSHSNYYLPMKKFHCTN